MASQSDSDALRSSWRIPQERKRLLVYAGVFVLASVCTFLANWLVMFDGPQILLVVESLTTLMALLLGVMTLVRFYSRREAIFLFIGTAFVCQGLLDAQHVYWLLKLPEGGREISSVGIVWTWTVAQIFLGCMLYLALRHNDSIQCRLTASESAALELRVYVGAILTTVALELVTFLPNFDIDLGNYFTVNLVEIIPTSLFILVLLKLLRSGEWKRQPFYHWLTIALVLNIVVGLGVMYSLDNITGFAHPAEYLLILLGHACVFVGLTLDTFAGFRQLQKEMNDRELAERSLHSSETKHRSVLETMVDGQITINERGIIQDFNPAAERLFGYKADEIIGRNVSVLMTEPNHAQHDTYLKNYRETGVKRIIGKSRELEGRRSDGSSFRLELSVAEMMIDGKRMFSGILRDTTSRWLADENAKRRERLLNATGSLANVGGWELDLSSNELLWTDEVFRIHEIPIGPTPPLADAINFYHPDDREIITSLVDELIATGASYDTELRMITAKGREIFVRVMGRAITIEKRIVRIFGAFQDVTTINQLQHEQQHFFNVSLDMISITTRDGRFRQLSPTWSDVLGWSTEELLARPYMDLVHPDDVQRTLETETQILGGQPVMKFDNRYLCKDGNYRWLSWRACIDKKLGLIFAVARDITDDKKRQKDLELARQEAESATIAKSQFLASMSHEIRTPMNAILGMSELLVDSNLNAEQKDLAKTVSQAAESLLNIINDILDFSKIEAGKLQLEHTEFHLQRVVESVVDLLSLRAKEKNINFKKHLDDEVMRMVHGDPMRLRQILTNLLSNAIKFTEQGFVDLTCSMQELRKQQDKTSMTVRFEIMDTGIGIPEEAHSRIFDSFAQANASTTRQYGGTGLGLSISKELVELMGGNIGFESSPGKGSRFWFTLTFDVNEHQVNNGKEHGREHALENISVCLYVEESQERKLLTSQLERWGAQVLTPLNIDEFHECLEKANNANREFDLLALDADTTIMSALEAGLSQLDSSTKTHLLLFSDSRQPKGLRTKFPNAICIPTPVKTSRLLDALMLIFNQRAEQQNNDATIDSINADQSINNSTRVLIVEDNPVNTKLAIKMLHKLGLDAKVATNGEEAVASVKQQHFDIILMDCQMPVMDGFDATKAIRALEAHGKDRQTIIAMTANAMAGDRERCLAVGMDDYISKPMRLSGLRETLLRWTNKLEKVT